MANVSGHATQPPQAAPRLDRATLTGVTLYAQAGEASLTFLPPSGSFTPAVSFRGKRGKAVDPERSQQESTRRAARRLRRWCASNGCYILGTLTFSQEPTLDDGWLAVEDFRRRWADAGLPPIAVVPEFGTLNGRLHFHFAASKYVPEAQVLELWRGRGFVSMRDVYSEQRRRHQVKRTTASKREAARVAAGYLSSYLTSAGKRGPVVAAATPAALGVGFNRRRYSIPKGTTPTPIRFISLDPREAWSQIGRLVPFPMHAVWDTFGDPSWRGPPCMLLRG